MKEKTLRYPGHVEYVNVLKETGFFDTSKVNIKGYDINPLEFTSKILFKEWKLNPGDGAFYGPKIDIKVKDCFGRKH